MNAQMETQCVCGADLSVHTYTKNGKRITTYVCTECGRLDYTGEERAAPQWLRNLLEAVLTAAFLYGWVCAFLWAGGAR